MVYFALRLLDGAPRAGRRHVGGALAAVCSSGIPRGCCIARCSSSWCSRWWQPCGSASDRAGVAAAAWRYVANWALTFVFSLPLLLPMWHQTTISAMRKQALSLGEFRSGAFTIGSWFAGLFNPFSNTHYASTSMDNWLLRSMPYLSHVGYITLLLMGVGLAAFFRELLGATRMKYSLICLAGAAASFLWSINALAGIMYVIPVLNRFRWPFRLQILTSFFLVAIATIGLAWLLGVVKKKRAVRSVFAVAVAATLANFLALYLLLPPRLFRRHQESVPLVEPLREQLGEGRMLAVGYPVEDQKSANSVGFDYATLWGLQSLSGHDPLVPLREFPDCAGSGLRGVLRGSSRQLPLVHLRRWGVRWYIVSNAAPEYAPVLLEDGMIQCFRDGDRTVFRDPEANPLVGWESGRAAGIDYRLTTNTIQVDADSHQDDQLRLRFAGNPFFTATVDGRPTAIATDEFGQMSVRVPAGRHRIIVRYRDRYLVLGSLLAAATAAVLAGMIFVRRARSASLAKP